MLKNLKQWIMQIKTIKQNISVCFAQNFMQSHHLKIGFNVSNICSGVTIEVWIMLVKKFLCNFCPV